MSARRYICSTVSQPEPVLVDPGETKTKDRNIPPQKVEIVLLPPMYLRDLQRSRVAQPCRYILAENFNTGLWPF